MNKKLKTLKDIEKENSPNEGALYYSNDVRNTAREWLKKLNSIETELGGCLSDESWYYNEGQIDWIKHFFNLEEEK
jgi:hypothetical protein